MKRLTLGVFFAACAFLAPGLAAADGERVINQGKALAGNVTPGDAAGFPVVVSRSGYYKLTSDLAPPDGVDAIAIAASFVTLDLNKFTIRRGETAVFK